MTEGRRRQSEFRDTSPTVSGAGRLPTDPLGQKYGHLLAIGHEDENLFPPLRGAEGALKFFADRRIKWWRSTRSGDTPKIDGPTRNLASSQIACVNFLLPLADNRAALLAIAKTLDDDVTGIVPLRYTVRPTGERVESLVDCEWIGLNGSLEGGRTTRGAHVTSVDALLVTELRGGGRRAYVIEWKYVEEYEGTKPKGLGEEGRTRRRRYATRYSAPDSPFSGIVPLDALLFDPFYQLMRMLLLGAKMVEEREFGATEAKLVVVCPLENTAYRNTVTAPDLAKLPAVMSLDVGMQHVLRDPSDFHITDERTLAQGVGDHVSQQWLAYQEARYGLDLPSEGGRIETDAY